MKHERWCGTGRRASTSVGRFECSGPEVAAAQENLWLSRVRFDGGEGLALDVVTSQSSLVQAQIDLFSARANYLNAQFALKVASAQ